MATLATTGCGNNLRIPWVELREATRELMYAVIDINMRINTYFPCSYILETNYEDEAPGGLTCLFGGQAAEGGFRPSPLLLIPPCPCPATPQFKVAGGLGSYHEMFCQIKCKQMTCTVDMATKQPCTQGLWRQHLTLPGWAQICRKDQSSQETAKVKDSISSPLPRCLEKYTAQHPGVC